jgi:hypothetical protein
MSPIAFWRGLFQVAAALTGGGFVGYCNGRVVAWASDRASVIRALILGGAKFSLHSSADKQRPARR